MYLRQELRPTFDFDEEVMTAADLRRQLDALFLVDSVASCLFGACFLLIPHGALESVLGGTSRPDPGLSSCHWSLLDSVLKTYIFLSLDLDRRSPQGTTTMHTSCSGEEDLDAIISSGRPKSQLRFAFCFAPEKALRLLENCNGLDRLPFEVGGRRKVQAVSLRGSLRMLYAPGMLLRRRQFLSSHLLTEHFQVDRCSEGAVYGEVKLYKLDCDMYSWLDGVGLRKVPIRQWRPAHKSVRTAF